MAGYASLTRPTLAVNLKPSTQSISLRLPAALLERIKIAADKRDVPYQSPIKTRLAEKADFPVTVAGKSVDCRRDPRP